MLNHKNFYVEAQALIVATGAVPFMPTFENDDVPGVYTAAVVQKMMNAEFTLLGKNILTVGAKYRLPNVLPIDASRSESQGYFRGDAP